MRAASAIAALLRGAVAAAGCGARRRLRPALRQRSAVVDVLKSARAAEPARRSVCSHRRRRWRGNSTAADISPSFKPNGTLHAGRCRLPRPAADGFADYRLDVDGLVEHPAQLIARRPEGAALAHADHPPRLRRGLERIGKWTGAPLAAVLDRARPEAGGAASSFSTAPTSMDGTSTDAVLREHRPDRRLPPADAARLRAERRARCRSPTARRCAAGRAPARLQAGQILMRHRARRELRRHRRRQGRLLGRRRLRVVRRHLRHLLAADQDSASAPKGVTLPGRASRNR